jgi:hypothetical protein
VYYKNLGLVPFDEKNYTSVLSEISFSCGEVLDNDHSVQCDSKLI